MGSFRPSSTFLASNPGVSKDVIAGGWLQGRGLGELAVVPLLLEELRVMMFAIQSAFQRRVVGEADGAAPMSTFEAGLVVR